MNNNKIIEDLYRVAKKHDGTVVQYNQPLKGITKKRIFFKDSDLVVEISKKKGNAL